MKNVVNRDLFFSDIKKTNATNCNKALKACKEKHGLAPSMYYSLVWDSLSDEKYGVKALELIVLSGSFSEEEWDFIAEMGCEYVKDFVAILRTKKKKRYLAMAA